MQRGVATASGASRGPSRGKMAFAAVGGVGAAMAASWMIPDAHASGAETADTGLHAPKLPWSHRHPLSTFDHAAVRRGYLVYKEVCAACHSLDRLAFRNLVGVTHTLEEAKVLAEEFEYTDGPN